MRHPARKATGLLLGAALLLAPTGGALAAPLPPADPVGDARSQAAVLRHRVAALQVQAELATEQYDAAYARLGEAVTAHLTAQRELQDAEASSGARDLQAGARVRALYMAGGTAGLYASVLDSGDVAEVLSRLHQVGTVLDGDRTAARSADAAVGVRARAEARLAATAARSTALQAAVSAQADAVRTLLAQADGLLAQADAQVRALVAEQQRAAEAAAAAAAAAELARLRNGGTASPDGLTPNLLPPGTPATPLAAAAIAFAQLQLGKPYQWGATGPDSYDCSGLTGAAYAAAGLHLPRVAADQWNAGPHVALADLQPGDLLFWASDLTDPRTIHHVALYLGNSLMLAAPHTGDVVKVQPVYLDGYLGATRPEPS